MCHFLTFKKSKWKLVKKFLERTNDKVAFLAISLSINILAIKNRSK
jgi:hypothetical protein